MRLWLPIVLVCVLVVPVSAEDPPADDPPPLFELPEVVVPGQRPQPPRSTPASVTVITRADLARLGARTVAEALRAVPEAMVRAYGGYGSLAEASIRGFGPGQVLVLVDGIPLNNIALGQADLSTVSTAGIERIEVLRGAFGAISGSGAVGGVISIVTGGEGRAVGVRAGGYGEQGIRVSAGGDGASLALESASASGSRPNSDAASLTAVGGLRLGGARLTLHHTRLELGTPGAVTSPTPQDRQSLIRTLGQVQWGSAEGPRRGRLFGGVETLTFTSPFGASTFASVVAGAALQRQWELAPARVLVAGVEGQHQALDAAVFGTPIVEAASVGAGFIQLDAAISARTLWSAAVRVDAHSSYGVTVNPRAGVVVALDEFTLVRAGVGRTFRGPTFLHLHFPGCSDPALRAESAWTAEASVERARDARITTITVFQTDARDLISGGCPPQNIGSALVRGVSGEVRAARGGWSIRAHGTVQEATDRTTGMPLPRVPALMAQVILSRDAGGGAAITIAASYFGPRSDLDFSAFPAAPVTLPGYVDLALRYERRTASGWTIGARVDNLLDTPHEVVKGYPAPGRTLSVSFSRSY